MPMSLEHCRERCERFIRNSLPSFEAVEAKIPTIPKFRAVPDARRNRTRFVEHAEPSWWQVPKPVWREAFNTAAGQAFLQSLGSTAPLSTAIGKSLWIPEIARGSTITSEEDLARDITRSYLFAAGSGRWRPHTFELIWKQCLDYFDPAKNQVTYVLYAPLWGFAGVQRRLSLGDGLEIRRLPHSRVAKIASLNNRLAGVAVEHRFTLWPINFFVKEFTFQKYIAPEEERRRPLPSMMDCTALFNEEVAMLRALLSDEVAVPTYAFVYDGWPRDGGGSGLSLSWRPRGIFVEQRPSRKRVTQYAKTRARFKSLNGRPGWPAVASSMRRFAVAWENPFPADTLADIIAALEVLLVREKMEVGYKLRVRASHMLASNQGDRQSIFNDIRDGYEYRSRIAHGEFVFDNIKEWETARAMKRVKVKRGNPFHDVNEVHRLTYALARYYRAALNKAIRSGELKIDWAARGI